MDYPVPFVGLSFLNVGSGTGYLSTMVGQALGPFDTNHGIELFEDAINYSQTNIEHFMKYSDGFQVTNFCRPHIVQGNVHSFDVTFRQYDRVYVGARLTDLNIKENIKELVKVGGILIFPTGENVSQYDSHITLISSHLNSNDSSSQLHMFHLMKKIIQMIFQNFNISIKLTSKTQIVSLFYLKFKVILNFH